ncbi:hypothetical protein [Asanoa siamensis]|uniref:hypothetical protein n=1 Tax=Asanoa siamensis TaxID=926357 RepID=UPI0019420D6B|nr:hypothetical protein [Asanoa siamensis]
MRRARSESAGQLGVDAVPQPRVDPVAGRLEVLDRLVDVAGHVPRDGEVVHPHRAADGPGLRPQVVVGGRVRDEPGRGLARGQQVGHLAGDVALEVRLHRVVVVHRLPGLRQRVDVDLRERRECGAQRPALRQAVGAASAPPDEHVDVGHAERGPAGPFAPPGAEGLDGPVLLSRVTGLPEPGVVDTPELEPERRPLVRIVGRRERGPQRPLGGGEVGCHRGLRSPAPPAGAVLPSTRYTPVPDGRARAGRGAQPPQAAQPPGQVGGGRAAVGRGAELLDQQGAQGVVGHVVASRQRPR